MTTVKKRNCGPCTACCRYMAVSELDPPKPAFQRCQHQRGRGCAIYKERPQGCSYYSCAWLLGLGPRQARPDKLGVAFSAFESPQLGPYMQAHELRKGALDKPLARNLVALAAQHGLVIHIAKGRRRVLGGPPEAVEAFRRRLQVLLDSGDLTRVKGVVDHVG